VTGIGDVVEVEGEASGLDPACYFDSLPYNEAEAGLEPWLGLVSGLGFVLVD
jgi:hypothetical protein